MLLRRQQSIILTSICALHEALRCSQLNRASQLGDQVRLGNAT